MTLRNLSADDPVITLDFMKSKQLDPRVTFTRASFSSGGSPYNVPTAGTGNVGNSINMFNVNVPRLTDQGLLIEESRINSVTTSGDVKTAAPFGQTGTSSYVTGIAPDGSSSTTLTNWVPDLGSTDNALYGIVDPGTPAAASVFIKANGWNYAGLWFNNIDGSEDGQIFIDLTTGEVLADENMSNTTVAKYGNGWWRVGGSSSTNSLGTLSIRCCSSSGSPVTPAMNGTDGILLWGLQVEAGGYPTSYIPTDGATVTRAADLCEVLGDNFSSWYNQNEWTVTNSFNLIGSNGASPNSASFFPSGGNDAVLTTVVTDVSGVGTADHKWIGGPNGTAILNYPNPVPPPTLGTDSKAAVSFVQQSTAEGACNGVLASNLTRAPSTYQNMIRLGFGQRYRGVTNTTGYIQRFSFYPTRVPETALRGLTQR